MQPVASRDGSAIALEQSGSGPHLLLVHGSASLRTRWAGMQQLFEPHFTITAMDRRGRGDSGDATHYALEREFEDIVAVAERLDGPVLLLGHSFGGLCALGAALMRADLFSALILYEPVVEEDGDPPSAPAGALERLEQRLQQGNREAVVRGFLKDFAGLTAGEIEMVAASPAWPGRVAAAHTLPREVRAEASWRLAPDSARDLSLPVLLLLGGDSPKMFARVTRRLARALPRAQVAVLPGQAHIAMDTAPGLLRDNVLTFWRDLGKPGAVTAATRSPRY
jgi:pimeloyl-ACP methyl ester carboxylesterase